MGIKNIFKRNKYLTVEINLSDDVELNCKEKKPNIPNGMWFKCEQCGKAIYKKDMEKSYMTCEECGSHFRLGALDRIKITLDQGTFDEFDKDMTSKNPLGFPCYEEKVKKLVESTKIKEAIITGTGKINGIRTAIGVMDSNFMMGSMGSVVGEKLTRLFEKSRELKLPVIVFTASGGARMQEGMFSLMQMAKVSAAVAKHNNEGLLYIVVLTDPTTGGVTASFAMLGDIILAEPGSLIGFAGKRVIEQTIKQELPKEFQKSEFLLDKGFVDSIVHRKDLRDTLYNILKIHM